MGKPKMAIVDADTLAVIGLRQILKDVIPIMDVEAFGGFRAFADAGADGFVHFFVAQSIVLEHFDFFKKNIHKTMVLTLSANPSQQLSGFHSLCCSTSEDELVKAILRMEQLGHPGGQNLPPMPVKKNILSNREIEVLSLICQGLINKEIADRLNIGLTTVITHRRNIMEKLCLRSVSALTIYAVMHGYVDINKI